ncbi:hypothetical protein KK083_19610 [Fulvivirgaceae bacterium PWU4]|uniref:Uncharacterized protein n=1 Tax=Chryseosolibacter histidini TaxID=2782349 RepID=A0AAP2GR16_9BACT|nr:hypothetical protein [Chryseosolibacter histidini]MBT1699112.1 hypothetical protein [Chryseosolibacter histidini]
METIIKVKPSELNIELLQKIKDFIGNRKNIEITISLNEFDPRYNDELDRSIRQAEQEANLISFTMEEFMSYTPKAF